MVPWRVSLYVELAGTLGVPVAGKNSLGCLTTHILANGFSTSLSLVFSHAQHVCGREGGIKVNWQLGRELG
jgi:hypothetical protein